MECYGDDKKARHFVSSGANAQAQMYICDLHNIELNYTSFAYMVYYNGDNKARAFVNSGAIVQAQMRIYLFATRRTTQHSASHKTESSKLRKISLQKQTQTQTVEI